MRIGWGSVVLTAAVVTLLPQPAEAGGSWLETDREYFSVGDHVVARGTFGTGSLEGRVNDGPFYAYLTPGDRAWDDPLEEDAISLGPLTITKASGPYCCWVAEVEFYRARRPRGPVLDRLLQRSLHRRRDWRPDRWDISVGDTEREARFAARLERARARVERLKGRLDQAVEDVAALESSVDVQTNKHARVSSLAPGISKSVPDERPLIGIEGAALIAGALLAAVVLLLGLRRSKQRSAKPLSIARAAEGMLVEAKTLDGQERETGSGPPVSGVPVTERRVPSLR